MRAALGFGVVLALSLGAPASVRAQDAPGTTHRHCPTCGAELPSERCPTCGLPPARRATSDEDGELDRVLRREYGDPNAPAPRRTRLAPLPPPPPPPPPPARHKAPVTTDEDEDFYVHLGLFGAHWSCHLTGASVSSARDGFHGDYVSLGQHQDGSGDGGEHDRFDNSQTQLDRAWIDLGPWFSFDGGCNRAWFRDSTIASRDFQFQGQQFTAGSMLETKFEFLCADFNFAVHPVHGPCGQLDLLVGFRYLWSNVEFTTNGNGFFAPPPGPPVVVFGGGVFGPPILPGPTPIPAFNNRVSQKNEALIPMIGIGGTFRPVHTDNIGLELFGRARAGAFDWEEQGWNENGDWVDRKFYAYSFELDAGVSLILFKTIGFTVGYHFDAAHIEREDNGDTRRAEWKAHGPYGGVLVQF